MIKVRCVFVIWPIAHIHLKKYDPITFVPLLIKIFTRPNFLTFLVFLKLLGLLWGFTPPPPKLGKRVHGDKILSQRLVDGTGQGNRSEGNLSEVLRKDSSDQRDPRPTCLHLSRLENEFLNGPCFLLVLTNWRMKMLYSPSPPVRIHFQT